MCHDGHDADVRTRWVAGLAVILCNREHATMTRYIKREIQLIVMTRKVYLPILRTPTAIIASSNQKPHQDSKGISRVRHCDPHRGCSRMGLATRRSLSLGYRP
jgi:hypothetical protein